MKVDVSDIPQHATEPPAFESKINLKTQTGNSFSQASLAPKAKTRAILGKKKKVRKHFSKTRSHHNLERDKSERIKLMEKKRKLMIKSRIWLTFRLEEDPSECVEAEQLGARGSLSGLSQERHS